MPPDPARISRPKTNDVIVASKVDNPGFRSTTLFVQLLPHELGSQLSGEESRQRLEEFLFKNDDEFRMQLQGVFGSFRPRCQGLSLDAAFDLFIKEKADRPDWRGTRRTKLLSAEDASIYGCGFNPGAHDSADDDYAAGVWARACIYTDVGWGSSLVALPKLRAGDSAGKSSAPIASDFRSGGRSVRR